MTASEAIKTPQMEVLVKRGREEQAIGISKSMNKLNLMQVCLYRKPFLLGLGCVMQT